MDYHLSDEKISSIAQKSLMIKKNKTNAFRLINIKGVSKKIRWKHTYQGLVRRFEHPVKFREAPQKPQTTTQIKSPQRIVIGSCFQKKI